MLLLRLLELLYSISNMISTDVLTAYVDESLSVKNKIVINNRVYKICVNKQLALSTIRSIRRRLYISPIDMAIVLTRIHCYEDSNDSEYERLCILILRTNCKNYLV